MPFIIESILPQNQSLATINENHSIQDAISIMIERDFSQLVVVDQHSKLRGLVTSDSILKALSFCETTVSQLKVSHALVKVSTYRIDEDLSDLLNGLRDNNAVPIVDKQEVPIAIVTSFDTTEYFRTKAEDIMLAEDIETTLRDLIESCYKDSNGDIDADGLAQAVAAITPSSEETKKSFQQALKHYLTASNRDASSLDQDLVDNVFQRHLHKSSTARIFGELTLFDYIQMFKNVWIQYQESFKQINWEIISKLLEDVRGTRNSIAHFREITHQKREQLKFCASLLDRHRPSLFTTEIEVEHSASGSLHVETIQIHGAGSINFSSSAETNGLVSAFTGLVPPIEEIGPSESRYAPLAVWLQTQEQDKVALSFKDVENIIQDDLPLSARRHRNWWANDSVSHSQSQQWLEVGWRVSNINLSEEKVIFSRISERKAAYANFFSTLQPKLESISGFSIQLITNPQGGYWVTFEVSAKNAPVAIYHISFARGAKLYIGQYIAMADRTRTEQIFDHLYQHKSAIEADFGGPLTWERLIGQQGARVAVYRDNSAITDPPETWEAMQAWLVETLPRFYHAFAPSYQAALDAIQPPSSPSA